MHFCNTMMNLAALYALFAFSANLVNANSSSLRGNNEIEHPVLKNSVAMYLLAEIEYGDKVVSGPRRVDYVRFADGTSYKVKNAPIGWQKGLASGKDLIKFPPGSVISSDGSIDMRGKKPAVANGILIRNLKGDDGVEKRAPKQERNLAAAFRSSSRNLQTGTRTVLAVRIILTDGEYNFASQTGLSDDVFGNGRDLHNLKSQFAACSNDQLILEQSPNRALTRSPAFPSITTAISNGVVDIKVNLTKSERGDVFASSILNAVTTEINNVFGVSSPNELADHVMFCMPEGVMDYIAYAWVYDWGSVYSSEWCNYLSVQMHELGHNFGYGHSNEINEADPNVIDYYADQTGYMGYGYGADDWPRMCFNGAKSWQTQWYSTKTRVVEPSAGGCFYGNIYGVADFSNAASSVVLVKINDNLSDVDFYVAFNRQSGMNSETQDGENQVMVTQQAGEGTSYAESILVAKLSIDGVWTGDVDGKTVSITVLRIDLDSSPAYATVRISESGTNLCETNAQSPTPSRTPTSGYPTRNPVTSAPTTQTPTGTPTSRSPTRDPTTRSPTCVAFNAQCSSGSNICCLPYLCTKRSNSFRCR